VANDEPLSRWAGSPRSKPVAELIAADGTRSARPGEGTDRGAAAQRLEPRRSGCGAESVSPWAASAATESDAAPKTSVQLVRSRLGASRCEPVRVGVAAPPRTPKAIAPAACGCETERAGAAPGKRPTGHAPTQKRPRSSPPPEAELRVGTDGGAAAQRLEPEVQPLTALASCARTGGAPTLGALRNGLLVAATGRGATATAIPTAP